MEEDEENTAAPSTSSVHHQQMTTISRHTFGIQGQTSDAFSINIIENIEEEYGMFVWPCSIVLAEYVWQQRSRFSGSSVLELGAGTSLPGLVAAKVGSDVTLSDDSSRVEVLENMRRVCDLNKLDCKWSYRLKSTRNIGGAFVSNDPTQHFMGPFLEIRVDQIIGLTWGEWDAPIFNLQPKIVLGADVLYDSKDFDNLFATVTFLLQNSPGSVFITSYHNRSGHHLIEYLMVKWSLKCTKLLDAFSFMPSCKSSTLTGNIQLVELMLDEQQS